MRILSRSGILEKSIEICKLAYQTWKSMENRKKSLTKWKTQLHQHQRLIAKSLSANLISWKFHEHLHKPLHPNTIPSHHYHESHFITVTNWMEMRLFWFSTFLQKNVYVNTTENFALGNFSGLLDDWWANCHYPFHSINPDITETDSLSFETCSKLLN